MSPKRHLSLREAVLPCKGTTLAVPIVRELNTALAAAVSRSERVNAKPKPTAIKESIYWFIQPIIVTVLFGSAEVGAFGGGVMKISFASPDSKFMAHTCRSVL